jgi:hypothetical protein
MVFVSGDPNPLGLENKDRRFLIVGDIHATLGLSPELIKLLKREQEVRQEYGPDARVVAPYSPSRKQRRAQKARERRSKGKK